jgi:ribonuclease HI
LAVQCSFTVGFLEPTVAKAWAMDQALQFGEQMGFNHLVLEGDAKVIVEAINSEDANWSMTGHLVMDLKTRLQEFEQWQVSAVGQERNNAAHCVAKMAI